MGKYESDLTTACDTLADHGYHEADERRHEGMRYLGATVTGALAVAGVWKEEWLPEWAKVASSAVVGVAAAWSLVLAKDRFDAADRSESIASSYESLRRSI